MVNRGRVVSLETSKGISHRSCINLDIAPLDDGVPLEKPPPIANHDNDNDSEWSLAQLSRSKYVRRIAGTTIYCTLSIYKLAI